MTYKIEVTAAEIVMIGQAIDLLPYGRVVNLVNKIQAQITVQDAAANAAAQRQAEQKAATHKLAQAVPETLNALHEGANGADVLASG